MSILVRRAKNDPFGDGRYSYITSQTVQILRAWLKAASIETLRLFRDVFDHRVGSNPLHPYTVNMIVKKQLTSRSNSDVVQNLSGHSMRVARARFYDQRRRSIANHVRGRLEIDEYHRSVSGAYGDSTARTNAALHRLWRQPFPPRDRSTLRLRVNQRLVGAGRARLTWFLPWASRTRPLGRFSRSSELSALTAELNLLLDKSSGAGLCHCCHHIPQIKIGMVQTQNTSCHPIGSAG